MTERRFASWRAGRSVLMMLGYMLSCCGGRLAAPPFVPPATGDPTLWTMSQRTGSVSYLTFAAGFSLAVYALFFELCDRRGWQTALFRIFGQNALVAYVIHPMVAERRQAVPAERQPVLVPGGGLQRLLRDLRRVQLVPRDATSCSSGFEQARLRAAFAARCPSGSPSGNWARCWLRRGPTTMPRAPSKSA